MSHKKRINTPKSWPIGRKENKFIVRPMPGPHTIESSIPLNLILKSLLKCAKTTREVKNLLNNGKILINNILRKDHHFPVGLMDTISIPDTNEYYRLLYNEKGKFKLDKINKVETEQKVIKIVNKKILKKKITQLNLYDGTNLLIKKDEFKVGDTIIIDPKNNIKKHIKLGKGAIIYFTGGKFIGQKGITEQIITTKGVTHNKIKFKLGTESHSTLKEYAYVIEK